MLTALVSPQGEVTLPEAVRKSLGLEHGGEIKFVEYESGWFALIALKDSISDLAGVGYKPGVHFSIEEMNDIASRCFVIEHDAVFVHAWLVDSGSAVDFVDCVIAGIAREAGCGETYTFDRKAARRIGMHLLG